MDHLDIEAGSLEDLEYDDFSDDNSSKARRKSNLPLANLMCTGGSHILYAVFYCTCCMSLSV